MTLLYISEEWLVDFDVIFICGNIMSPKCAQKNLLKKAYDLLSFSFVMNLKSISDRTKKYGTV